MDKPPAASTETLTFYVDGRAFTAARGQTLGAALLAQGVRVLRQTRKQGRPRGLFCAMGVCYDCTLTVDGKPGMRACMTPVAEGMRVERPIRFEAQRVP
jgi:predicted molibdopterin-dependent oxidoreductase YjgC